MQINPYKYIAQLEEVEKLSCFFALSHFWKNAFYINDYKASDLLPNLLIPTDEGLRYIEIFEKSKNEFPQSEIYLALFQKFYHHHIIFDWEKSDFDGVKNIFQEDLFEGRIHLPSLFGRVLYDKFNDMNPSEPIEEFSPEETHKLIEGTPIGVYQMGNLICGPLGISTSLETRTLPLGTEFNLWHCSDPGCMKPHSVNLTNPSIALKKVSSLISEMLEKHFGIPTDWERPLLFIDRVSSPSTKDYIDIIPLLADCIIGSERTAILKIALQGSYRDLLRSTLASPPRNRKDSEGPPDKVASSLDQEEQLQLLSILPNSELIKIIDSAVQLGEINIGIGEIRVAKKQPPPYRYNDANSQLTVFGIRSNKENPIVFFTYIIIKAHTEKDLAKDLDWHLRGIPGNSIQERLVFYIRTKGIYETLSQIILSSRSITKYICDFIGVSNDKALTGSRQSTNFLLWKLGFMPAQFDDFAERFASRLDNLKKTVLKIMQVETEDEREKIRAAGVNLFISVEEFLEQLLVYNIWLLASDHFFENRYIFDFEKSRVKVAEILGDELLSNDIPYVWNKTGENTIGVLMRYLSESVKWMKALLDEEKRSTLLRPIEDLPHYAKHSIIPFPFRHKCLWADSDRSELINYMDGYSDIVKLLENANLAFIRNSLDHKRSEARFPETDHIIASLSYLAQAFDNADVNRYLPKIFWLSKINANRFGDIEFEFQDYKSRNTIIYGPCMVMGLPAIADYGNRVPFIIAPGNLLGKPNSPLLFQLSVTNEYKEFWTGYPRRRSISVAESETADLNQQIN